jgi:hypothetical protein
MSDSLQNMRQISLLFLGLTVTAAALLHFDRTSSAALYLVELESSIGLPLPALLGGLTLTAWILSGRKRYRAPSPPPTRRHSSQNVTQPTAAVSPKRQREVIGVSWLEAAKANAKQLDLPAGARIVFDLSHRSPIELRLEQAPPERCKRAIEVLAQWITTVPTPPRIRVVFDHCPESGSPRHHQVSGALARHIVRSQFKAMMDLDAVDVLFHHADPCWQEVRVQT